MPPMPSFSYATYLEIICVYTGHMRLCNKQPFQNNCLYEKERVRKREREREREREKETEKERESERERQRKREGERESERETERERFR